MDAGNVGGEYGAEEIGAVNVLHVALKHLNANTIKMVRDLVRYDTPCTFVERITILY
jgi:hypothetical protein